MFNDTPIHIEPEAIYRDGDVRLLLGFTSRTLADARRTGRLRYARRGRMTYYLGRWILNWLTETETQSETPKQSAGP